MEILLNFLNNWKSAFFTTVFFVALYMVARRLLKRQANGHTDKGLIKSIFLFCIVLVGIISVVLALPMSPEQKGHITSLIGIVLSAVLGLSSTTFIGNALAGIALKLRRSFKPGDYIKVNDIYGRVTEQGLFHTEIQTIDRDLTTLPNMTLASNAVKVTRSSGSFISAEVSLGYDINRLKIEEALIKAAIDCGLTEPFVHIISLGDFSIVYRVHGLLDNVKSILTTKSRLIGHVIDSLHEAKIEIVSPNFMNQKQVGDTVFIPHVYKTKILTDNLEQAPEDKIFDKADEAENLEKRKAMLAELEKKIKEEEAQFKHESDAAAKIQIEEKLKKTKLIKQKLEDKINMKLEELDKQ